MSDEWDYVRGELAAAGVGGVDDFGLFVNNTNYFEPSHFDERSAGATLLRLLPTLEVPGVVRSAAGHLRRPWLKQLEGSYEVLREVYLKWAGRPGPEVAWYVGDTLCRAATKQNAADLLALAARTEHRGSRGCIVESLWRFKSQVAVEPLLRELIADPSVSYMALSSLQRTIGAEAMEPVVERLIATSSDPLVTAAAERQLKRIRKKLAATRNT